MNEQQSTTDQTVANTVEHASSTLHNAINSTSKAVHPAVDHLSDGAHHAVDKLAGVAISAAESIEQKTEGLRETQLKFVRQCRYQLHDKPVVVLGLAVTAGFLVGWLLKKR
jgi:ElaB/YqjD/DUF883 family membrane-anchored ribosome-binding protein